jgi:hypothetical protein
MRHGPREPKKPDRENQMSANTNQPHPVELVTCYDLLDNSRSGTVQIGRIRQDTICIIL